MKRNAPTNAFEQLILDLSPRYGAGEARSVARIVFEDAFDVRRPAGHVFSPAEEERFLSIRKRLLQGEPVQYVLGQADFYGLKFKVSPAVLIPRQETEELVAWVLEWLKARDMQAANLLDIGLGSGCIGVTLKYKRPDIRMFGLEKSPEALQVAIENARRILGETEVFFAAGDILKEGDYPEFPAFDLIVSNPPYVPVAEQALMPDHVLRYEPELALFVPDSDPLRFYRHIAGFASLRLKSGGALFFECNEFNTAAVGELLRQTGFSDIVIRKDLSGADRMIMGQIEK